jgi:hypothetical protein
MTSKQCLKMIKSMKRDVCKSIDEEASHLLQSGGIALSDYPLTTFIPAKIVLTICLERIAHQYEPLLEVYKAEYRNLKHF